MGFRPAAATETKSGQCQGGAHQAEEVSTGEGILFLIPFRGPGGEFTMEPFLKILGTRIFAETAPVAATACRSGGMLKDSLHR